MYESSGDRLVVYDPQVDAWENHERLRARSAVVVTPKKTTENFYGLIEYEARTEVHPDTRTVLVKDRKLVGVRFPGLPGDKAAKAEDIVTRALPIKQTFLIPLDLILAYLQAAARKAPPVRVSFDPPPIHTSEQPAILVMFMGEPSFKPVPGTDLHFAVNTNWDVFHHPASSTYYLLNGEGWIATGDLKKGPWKPAEAIPESLWRLPADKNWDDVRKQLPGKKLPVPVVFLSTQPAELIVTDGPPKFKEIPGTRLLDVTNTRSYLFKDSGDGKYYLLTSGRWFRAEALTGPWSAATSDLPADFARIPVDHEDAEVRVSVPGTPEAADAILLAQVPRKASIDPSKVTVQVTYDGGAKFDPIEGTKVSYAVNTSYDVFLVNGQYYCCHNAVWFVAGSATGPWVVCTSVPAEIYTIPSTHPKHSVTYVYVYESSPTVVVVGYTAGYSGVYVSSGVVVFGLGWACVWGPYAHYHYHSCWYAYGCGAHYSHYHGGFYSATHVYGPYGGAGWGAGYNPHTGTYARGSYAYGPHGSRYFAEAYNPYTNTYKGRTGGSTPYAQWERGVAIQGDDWVRGGYYQDSRGTAFHAEGSGGGSITGVRGSDGSGSFVGRTQDGDLYVGHDGNVYKKDDGQWQKYENGSWTSPDKSTGAKPSTTPSTPQTDGARATSTDSTRNSLESDSQARSRGWENTNRRTQASTSGSSPRGGRRGR
jgi:hypothetical protein